MSSSIPSDTPASSSHEVSTGPNASWKESAVGDNRGGNPRNISWGAVIAGVVTFLALTILLSLITATLGLGMADLNSNNPGEGVGIATGISSIITLALALAAGGYVAGALSARSGLIHGFLTWATSLLAVVVLAGLLVGNILGAAGSIVGSAASAVTDTVAQNPEQAASAAPDVSAAEASAAAQDAQEQTEETLQENAPEAEEAADNAAASTLWTFFGLLIGAVVASFTGLAGARSVTRKSIDEHDATTRH